MKPLLRASKLRKSYQDLIAVDEVSFAIEPGQCLALLGPNGAGKTTTVEMLAGLVQPDQGEIELLGEPLSVANRSRLMEQVGVTLQENQLYKKMTVRETLQLFASFFKRSQSVADIMQLVELQDKADARLEQLSGGQKQRTYLACALINLPKLVFLDEPTTGLDPQSRRAIWQLLAKLKSQGTSLLLTTHYMEEAAFLADQVAIIEKGKIIANDSPEGLISKHCGEQRLVVTLEDVSQFEELKANISWLKQSQVSGQSIDVVIDQPTAQLSELCQFAESKGIVVADLALRRSNLEDVYLQLTGRQMIDA